MRLVYLVVSFLALFFLDIYLKINIAAIGGEGEGVQLLSIFMLLAFALFIWRLITSKSVLIRPSVWLFCLFIYYFMFRVAVDTGSIDKLKAFTVATSSGVILYYVVGALISIILGRHAINVGVWRSYLKYYKLSMTFYVLYGVISLLWLLYELSSRVRADIILLADGDGAYQRPGNFLIISYLLLVVLYTQYSSLKRMYVNSSNCLIFESASLVLFIFYTITSLFIAQLLGSNSATVVIAGLGLIFITMTGFFSFKNSQMYLGAKKITFLSLIHGKLLYRLLFLAFVALISFVLFIWFVANFLDIDLSMTRLGGFGSGQISSVDSRLNLLDNFVIHFSNSPILGDMTVDCLTTGCGSYVHSLPASLLTHTGLVGSVLFFAFLVLIFKERFSSGVCAGQETLLSLNIINIYSFLNLLFIIAIASIANFFSWAVLWFSLGLFSLGLVFKNKRA